jgi:hypothetical protein
MAFNRTPNQGPQKRGARCRPNLSVLFCPAEEKLAGTSAIAHSTLMAYMPETEMQHEIGQI